MRYTGPVSTNPEHEHVMDPRTSRGLLPKTFLVYHVRVAHAHNGRIECVAEDPQRLRKWGISDLRQAHDELHGEHR